MSVKQAKLLEGKVLAGAIQEGIQAAIADFKSKGLETPRLQVIQVSDDPSTHWYVDQQEKLAKKLGIDFRRDRHPDDIKDQKTLENKIRHYSQKSKETHGIFISMPLPELFDVDKALLAMDSAKDVEGIHPESLGLIVQRNARLIPPTAYAAMKLLESTGVEIRGKRAVVVGQSAIVGRPVHMLLGEHRATVTICNTGTTPDDLNKAVSESDIVIACAGQPGIIKGVWIKPGAVVIDVGTTQVNGRLIGDVEFEEACNRAGFITPVPGGVGPLTVTMLMQNLILAYKWQKGLK